MSLEKRKQNAGKNMGGGKYMILAYMTLKKHALTHSKKMLKVKIMLEYSI